ncbi:nitrogen fixation protein NifQ [Novosphingobium sp. Rr 2-17]|uniref:nitrogen fixation protein NifQ n=1 Tax=Novosphingobium sp. Rr 2-17 TaxID=555793 RepID=UPI000269A7F0|nr:nitrogen fixation protein NifQ [Novosphingobium sp. Rr 2-17]EIZ79681.1 nitrogen fixation protein NifQ [Novosphingobium sp. Rr 2-17]
MRADGEGIYTRLTGHGTAHGTDLFDLHVIASVISLAAHEEPGSLAEGLGLEPFEVRALFLELFPGAIGMIGEPAAKSRPLSNDERALRDIFWHASAQGGTFARLLARIMARRCQRPNHLWQDLGLGSRRELTLLMARHYPQLALRNANDMKWKKFLYRMICSSTGFSLCLAPLCSECDDFDDCFGPEEGDNILARLRNDRPAPHSGAGR